MGLVGLTSFLAEQRTKEIGIRRTLGSTVNAIIGLMAKEFLWLLLVANIISWPITYYLTTDWLESYSSYISTNWLIYILSAILTLFIAISIITFRAYRTALLNPAETLRHE
jgi:putative ABC transport system permease protein